MPDLSETSAPLVISFSLRSFPLWLPQLHLLLFLLPSQVFLPTLCQVIFLCPAFFHSSLLSPCANYHPCAILLDPLESRLGPLRGIELKVHQTLPPSVCEQPPNLSTCPSSKPGSLFCHHLLTSIKTASLIRPADYSTHPSPITVDKAFSISHPCHFSHLLALPIHEFLCSSHRGLMNTTESVTGLCKLLQ